MTADAAAAAAQALLGQLGVGASDLDRIKKRRLSESRRTPTARPRSGSAPWSAVMRCRATPSIPKPGNFRARPMLLAAIYGTHPFFPTRRSIRSTTQRARHVKRYTGLGDAEAARLIASYRKKRGNADNTFLYQLLSADWWMTANVTTQAERKARLGRAPAYVYHFEKRTPGATAS